ncbi:MAG: MBL fold metallo-hydrolase [Chloroflexi bacterium]|nr:MBL fold metallo-hydrolase [Chloroflexota bacterium]
MTAGIVEARPAATVVLLRSGPSGLEALLTRRPATMAFAPDMHVFPGGRVDAGDADPALAARSVITAADAASGLGGDLEPSVALAAHVAAIRELFEEAGVLLADTTAPPRAIAAGRSALLGGDATMATLAAALGLTLRTDRLVPLSRWVTPPGLDRRFDTRFFAASLEDGIEASFEGDEVADHAWLRPTDALAEMAGGRLAMWPPTSATLQQLEYASSLDEIRMRLAPGRLGEVTLEAWSPVVTRVTMPAGGGVAGQPVCAYLIGRQRCVLVDPGDPTGPALDRAIGIATARGATIDAIVLTHADPDHAGGAAVLAERLAVPILVGPGGGGVLPFEVRELTDLESLDAGDVELQAVLTPGPRPDHVAYQAADDAFVVTGDLDGVRGERSILGPPDPAAWAMSRARLRELAPDATWLTGHPSPATPTGQRHG